MENPNELRIALEASIKLESHYANLLNMHDGGERIGFASADDWIARLRETGTLPKEPAPFQIELNEETEWIFGQLCFMVISYVEMLRKMGRPIKRKAEAEQAAAIHWMLNLYLEHGDNWRAEGRKIIDDFLAKEAADAH